jgi:SAM-dependent methyltransferase
MADWGSGSYELTAAQLEPVSRAVVDAVEPVVGQKLLDVACGTGNAALEAASRGAEVTGADGATRLLRVARERAARAGLSGDWVECSFAELPFPDRSFEIVTSVFGVVFAADPVEIAGEVARVLDPSGRIAFTTWIEDGLMGEISKLMEAAVTGTAPENQVGESEPFDWGDESALRMLFAEHGLAIQCEERAVSFTADSPAAMSDEWAGHHPVWLATKGAVGEERYAELRDEIRDACERFNEDPAGMKLTSRYLLAMGSPV